MTQNPKNQYSRLQRLQMGAYRTYAAALQAMPIDRSFYDQWTATVTEVIDVAACVKRITLHAREFTFFTPNAPDEYFGLIIPPVGAPLTMPNVSRMDVRAAIAAIPEPTRPYLRFYTIRHHRPVMGEIDVDIVTHGDAGPGSAWALSVSAGDRCGYRVGSGAYVPPKQGEHHLLIADETALPAVAAIADALRTDSTTHNRVTALVELPDDGHATDYTPPFASTTLYRGHNVPGSALLPALPSMDLPPLTYAWVCGESALATGARRHLVKTLNMPRRNVMFSGYWKRGVARS